MSRIGFFSDASICWLANGDERYGVSRAIIGLASALSRRGFKVNILCLREGLLSIEANRAGLRVHSLNLELPPTFGGGTWRLMIAAAKTAMHAFKLSKFLSRELVNLQPGILHFVWPNHLLLCARAAKQAGCSVVWEMPNVVRGDFPLHLNRAVYQVVCRLFNVYVIANSHFTARSFGSMLLSARVMHLGVEADGVDQEDSSSLNRHDFGIPENAMVLGMVSRLDRGKGHELAIRCISRHVADGLDVHLIVVGGPLEGPYAEELRKEALRANLASRVHFVGESRAAQRFFRLFDVFLQMNDRPEAFGLAVVEAMMAGVPVVARSIGGPGETVLDGVTGWLFDSYSVDGLNAALLRAVAEKSRWREFRDAAKDRATRLFSLNAQAERYEEILRESGLFKVDVESRGGGANASH